MIDYFRTESLLTEAERLYRDRIRKFVDEECMPLIADHFDKGIFPMDLIRRMAEMGLFGLHVDGYGCQRMSHTIYGLICQELGRCDSGLRAMVSVQNSLVMYPIFTFGSEEQKKRWLPKMARGEAIGCFGLSEPDFGSNPSGMATRAEKHQEGVPSQWHEDVDHQRIYCPCVIGLGKDGWRDQGFLSGSRDSWISIDLDPEKIFLSDFSYFPSGL